LFLEAPSCFFKFLAHAVTLLYTTNLGTQPDVCRGITMHIVSIIEFVRLYDTIAKSIFLFLHNYLNLIILPFISYPMWITIHIQE